MTQDSQYSTTQAAAAPTHQVAGLAATGTQAPMQQTSPTVLSNQDFLSRVEAAKADIRQLTQYISEIASAHQRTLNSPDASSNSALESIITQTQVLNTSIKDQIKYLETDAARSGRNNNIKNSQVGQLKTSFKKQLEEYRNEEASYERRYREQIARQYRIVNEGVFQTAVRLALARPSIMHANIISSSRPTARLPPAPFSVPCVLVTTTFNRLSVL
jgi:syntaxin 1B/2/3